IGWDIIPNDTGGITIVHRYPDGTEAQFILNTVAIPPMPANGDLLHDFFFATVIGGANFAINTLNPFIGWYNTQLGLANNLASVGLQAAASKAAKPAAAPPGSVVRSPDNRRNPDRTTLLGSFGWDTLPGLYRVQASHSRCRAASTPLFVVPPPRANLALRLRC